MPFGNLKKALDKPVHALIEGGLHIGLFENIAIPCERDSLVIEIVRSKRWLRGVLQPPFHFAANSLPPNNPVRLPLGSEKIVVQGSPIRDVCCVLYRGSVPELGRGGRPPTSTGGGKT